MKELRLRWDSACARCGAALPARTPALWDSDTKSAFCLACPAAPLTEHPEAAQGERLEGASLRPTNPQPGDTAGASAQREYERRSTRERQRKEKALADDAAWRAELIARRPMLGRIRASIVQKPTVGPDSRATKAWKVGAEGERRVAEILGACPDVEALHDLRIPGSRANIDHIAVAPAGVFVIDRQEVRRRRRSARRGHLATS